MDRRAMERSHGSLEGAKCESSGEAGVGGRSMSEQYILNASLCPGAERGRPKESEAATARLSHGGDSCSLAHSFLLLSLRLPPTYTCDLARWYPCLEQVASATCSSLSTSLCRIRLSTTVRLPNTSRTSKTRLSTLSLICSYTTIRSGARSTRAKPTREGETAKVETARQDDRARTVVAEEVMTNDEARKWLGHRSALANPPWSRSNPGTLPRMRL